MAMNGRLLRPRASGFDADALRYITAVRAADGQSLEAGVRKAINDFVVGCKADGIWSPIKASCILAGARTLAGALTPLVGTAPTNNGPFVSGDYNRKTGLVGNGTTKYLDSGRAGNADPQDNHHRAVWVTTAATSAVSAFPVYIGNGGSNPGATHFGRLSSNGLLFFRDRNAAADTAAAGSGPATGLIGHSRSASLSYATRIASAGATVNQTSETSQSRSVFVFAASQVPSGVIANTISNSRIAFYSIGESLNLSQLESRLSTLIAAIGAAIP